MTNHFCDRLPAALAVDLLRGWHVCSGDVLGSLDQPLERSPIEGGAAPGIDVLTPDPNPNPHANPSHNSPRTLSMLQGYLESEVNLHPCKI